MLRRVFGRTQLCLAVALTATVAAVLLVERPGAAPARKPRPMPDAPPRSFMQGGFGGGGFGPQQDLEVVRQFDSDGDQRLDAAERKAARAFLERRGGQGRLGRRFGTLPATPGPSVKPSDVRSYPKAPLFDNATLRTIFLQFEEEDWEAELTAFYHTDVEVPATMTVDGNTFKDVGVHFRGNSSFRMVPEGRKHSMTLSLDFVHDRQQLGGYHALHLLNSHEDPTMLRSVLYAEIARDFIPAPKANHVRVVINGESWGIYVNAQPFNKDFVRDWFNTTDGARWKVPGNPRGRAGLEYLGEDVGPYHRLYEIRSKDDVKSWADLIALCRTLEEAPPGRLEAALAPILDVDGALKFLALDNALVNNDGYWVRASDYSLYRDVRGRFHVIPQDFNETLNMLAWGPGFNTATNAGNPGTAELDPLVGVDDGTKPLRSKLLAVPALRAKYLAYTRAIAERWLDWNRIGPIAERYQALIEADVRTDTHKLSTFDDFNASSASHESLKTFVTARRAFLLKTLPSKP